MKTFRENAAVRREEESVKDEKSKIDKERWQMEMIRSQEGKNRETEEITREKNLIRKNKWQTEIQRKKYFFLNLTAKN